MAKHADVVVLGAGLTGATAALALARAGVNVVLIDQDQQPMNRASLRNEGKIHLGFVFANDHTLATARLMIEGALPVPPVAVPAGRRTSEAPERLHAVCLSGGRGLARVTRV